MLTIGIVYSMMIALGEMTTLYPVNGAFVHFSSRFVDPSLGFALGWVSRDRRASPKRWQRLTSSATQNYWYSWAISASPVLLYRRRTD